MSSETATEMKYCSNCKKDIAAANFTMHEVHCRRHLTLCEHCNEPVPRTEMEQHFTDVHAKVPCSQCSLELEKEKLDDHLENECPKRHVSCEYCELQVPQCELSPHLEFCSTRTEACPRCSNFIMHKDLQQHNASNCTYPEAKPPPKQPTMLRDRGGGGHRFSSDSPASFWGYGQLDDSFDPFEFEEIRRALEGDGEGRGMPSLLVEDSDGSAAAGGSERSRRVRGQGPGMGRKPATKLPAQKKNDTRGGDRKAATNRRSEVNRRREQAPQPAIPPDVDYDTMLAMQLAADDRKEGAFDADPDTHLNELINSYEKRSSRSHHIPMEIDDGTVPASPPPGYDDFAAADEDMIPCEFCGESFPAFALVHHQSVCDPLASGLWGSSQEGEGFGRNNDFVFNQWRPGASRPPAIPVINNLGSASPAEEGEGGSQPVRDHGDHLNRLDSLEMTMLPCEFCCELLPADSLVQHQAMCEGKPATPRVTTPAAAQPSSGFSGRNQRYHFFPTPNSGPRLPSDPTGALLADINSRGQENMPGSVRPKKKPNVPRGGSSWTRTEGPVPALRTGVTHSQQRRPGSNRGAEEEEDISLHVRRGNYGRQDSASRTRHTLNSLLSDEGGDSPSPGGGSRERTSQNRFQQGSRRRTPNTVAGSLPTGVSSRTVMRSMQQQDRQRRPRGDSATEVEGHAAGGRRATRERGDHLFNSSSNTRNSSNPSRFRNADRPPQWD